MTAIGKYKLKPFGHTKILTTIDNKKIYYISRAEQSHDIQDETIQIMSHQVQRKHIREIKILGGTILTLQQL